MTEPVHRHPEDLRVFVLGLDGATLDVVRPWAEEGDLPTFAKIMREGAWGELRSTIPPLTAPAWTSFATGKNPGKHGLYDFTRRVKGSYKLEVPGARARRSATLWQILSQAGRRVGVLNVPVTYPPEGVNGFMVTGMLTPYDADQYTYPPQLKEELRESLGGYEVFPHDIADPQGRIEEYPGLIQHLAEMRMKAADYLMENWEWDFFMVVFNATDLIQHAFWHTIDPSHPWHDPSAPEHVAGAIKALYQEIDRYLEHLLDRIGKDCVLIIMSDHGFGPQDGYIYVNNWLIAQGLMKLKRSPGVLIKRMLYQLGITPANLWRLGLSPSRIFKLLTRLGFREETAKSLSKRSPRTEWLSKTLFLSFSDVDWKRTKAYSLGNIGPVYLNVAGREPEGIVSPGQDYEEVLQQITELLYEIRDPVRDQQLVDKVYRRDELYWGDCADESPDLFFMPKDLRYIALGQWEFFSNATIEANSGGISGVHRMNGILMVGGPGVQPGLNLQGAQITDLAPTILAIMGVPIPDDLDGEVLGQVFTEQFWSTRQVSRVAAPSPGPPSEVELSDAEEEQIKKRLRGLGYL